MDAAEIKKSTRRPRFQRASEPPAFRCTQDDVEILRLLVRHRFLRSTHIAALVNRSLDRTNDRLHRLFHAGYVDRPRAQLDYYPTRGSGPMVYALADRGARLLAEHEGAEFANMEWSRKNREAGRPFIEHQLEMVDFYIALQLAMRGRPELQLIHPDELIRAFPDQYFSPSSPFKLRTRIAANGTMHDIAAIPDLAFGIRFADGSRRCFMVEIDRGTMPVERSDIRQTSFERKMRAYLAAHATRQHEVHFGWKTFRVLTVTTDRHRLDSMREALQSVHVPHSPGSALFFFAERADLQLEHPLSDIWCDGNGRSVMLV